MAEGNNPGEEKAWELLATLDPDEVCRTASVAYDRESRCYIVKSFGMDFRVSVKDRTITSSAPGSGIFLTKLAFFFRLSVLWYLVNAKDIDCSREPVKLEQIKGGDIFTRGSHVLPLDAVANRYGKDKDAFAEKGLSLGAGLVPSGDASLSLAPLPRIPVLLTLWLEDEECPARVDLKVDSTCNLHLPVDIIWSVAMMSLLAML
jgi:hypothetical protein